MVDKSNIKIVVASHKPYWTPDDELYLPLQVGASGKQPIDGFLRDDMGDNISTKNDRYSELTALYWAWKNVDANYVGLVHYRRYFAGSGERGVASCDDVLKKLKEAPILLPKKRHYYIETVGSHYAHTFSNQHLKVMEDVLRERSEEYSRAFREHLQERSSHIWNMGIMRDDILDKWCSWLFPVLFEVERRIDFQNLTDFEARLIGRLSERLLDPWIVVNGYETRELSVKSLEKINWVKKGGSFLRAKYLGSKYTESF